VPTPHLRSERWQILNKEVRIELFPVVRLGFRLRCVHLYLVILVGGCGVVVGRAG